MIVQGVVALCMFINGELKEHRIQPAMSDCLKGKREASRDLKSNMENEIPTLRKFLWEELETLLDNTCEALKKDDAELGTAFKS